MNTPPGPQLCPLPAAACIVVPVHVHPACASERAARPAGAPVRREQREGGDAKKMASGNNANVVAFPDLAPKGSRGTGGKRALMGPEIGTQFLM